MVSGTPDWSPRIITSGSFSEQLKIAVDEDDSSDSFSQEVRSMTFYNDGPNAVHFNEDAAATTNHFKVPAKAWFSIDIPVTTPHFICAAGETATIYVIGVW